MTPTCLSLSYFFYISLLILLHTQAYTNTACEILVRVISVRILLLRMLLVDYPLICNHIVSIAHGAGKDRFLASVIFGDNKLSTVVPSLCNFKTLLGNQNLLNL